MDDYQQTYSWDEAIRLSLQIYDLSDELPTEEEATLKTALRNEAVEIPATVAADLVASRTATLAPILRLQTELELIRRIYPALDTADVDEAAAKLYERLTAHDAFIAVVPAAEPEEAATEPGALAEDHATGDQSTESDEQSRE